MIRSDRKTMWNDGPSFESLLDDPHAAHPVANRHICNGGGEEQEQQSFTTQSQQQQGRSETQPNSFVQGPLKGITDHIYGLYTQMPGGNPVPEASDLTQGFWTGAMNLDPGTVPDGVAGLGALPIDYVKSVLRGDYLDLSRNPYFQGALTASLAPATENFAKNIVPTIQSTFASVGRPGSFANAGKIDEATTSFNRAVADASTKAGNEAFQFERGQQGTTLGMTPQLNAALLQNEQTKFQNALAKLGVLAQAGQSKDAYALQRTMGPTDFATRAGMSILGLYPGGITDSTGWSSGSGSSVGYGGGGGGGAGSLLGAGMGLAGLGLQAASVFSDNRAKTDIEPLGIDPLTGLPMFAYRYKSDPKEYPKVVGPMAQDIEEVRPDLVREIGGHRVVAMPVMRPQSVDPLTNLPMAA